MTIRGVVFDLDGVLINSELCWQRAREAFAAERGAVWTQALQTQSMGTASDYWLRLMQQHIAPDMPTDAIYADMIERMRAEYTRDLPLREGAAATVRELADHYSLALASGAPAHLIDYIMTTSGLGGFMATLVYGDTIPGGKPDPAIYIEALRRLDISAEEAVGVEDSTNGLTALFRAGLRSIAAPVPGFEPDAATLARADRRIATLPELTPQLIAGIESR